jgi:hypothetical protein
LIQLRLARLAAVDRLDNPVAPRSHDTPLWRTFGAALGAFAIGVQLLLSVWLIVQAAGAGSQAGLSEADLAVICTHDPAATADEDGAPPTPHQHGQCPACACPQWAKLLAPLPTPPVFLVLRPHSQTPPAYAGTVVTELKSPSPYSSRAPPFSA